MAAAAAAGKDTYAYPEVEVNGEKYNFRNNWLYSRILGNWNDNRPNPLAEGSRSVVEKDGILYFSYRDNNTPKEQPKLVRVDAKTGKMLDITVIYPHEPKNEYEKSKETVLNLIDEYKIDVIAIDDEVCLFIECKATSTIDRSKVWCSCSTPRVFVSISI